MNLLVAACKAHAAQLAPQHHAVLATFSQTAFEVGEKGIKDAEHRPMRQADGKALGTSELAYGAAYQAPWRRARYARAMASNGSPARCRRRTSS